jgi:hypothetical protein
MKTWQMFVQQSYSSLEELKTYDEIYGIAKRCEYSSAEALWTANPMIGGSTNPSDFGVIQPNQ